MECATGVAAAASVAGKVAFDYNRENFHYDRELRQKKELHTLKYRVCQASQWRADIRDLISLTEYKMHIYLLVNVLLLAFAVTLWCEGRLPQGTPPWMMLGMSIATAAASTFLLLSIWFAMHAAVAAQSFEVRLLTQMVRLPIPSWQEVEACRTYGSGFEKVEAKQMFRVPFAMGRQESMALRSTERRRAAEATTVTVDATSRPPQAVEEGPADPWGLEGTGQHIEELGCPTSSAAGKCRHVKLALKAAIHWQSYDAFARISMSIGVNQLLLAIAYYLLGYIFVEVGVRSSAFLGVCVLGLMQEALTRLDMSLSAWQLHTVQFLLFMGPLFTCLASYFWSRGTDRGLDIAGGLIPFAFLFHGLYILVMTRMCRIQEQSNGAMLPMALGSVLFLDVFGHMRSDDEDVEEDPLPLGGIPPASDADIDAPSEESLAEEPSRQTCRPGLQAMQYSRGEAVPTRPEHAANTDKDMRHVEGAPSLRPGATEGDFYESSLFMPHAVASEADEELDAQLEEVSFMTGHEHEQPGALPWTVFKVAMLLLWVTWLFAAIYSALIDARVWTLEIPFTEDVVDDLGVPSGYEVEPAANDTKHTKGQVSLLASSSRAQIDQGTGSLWKFWKSALLVTHEILGGTAEELELVWPDLVGAPSSISLSCDAAGQHFVASDGLLTWAADLREEVPGTSAFLHRPWPATCSFAEVRCPGLAGEALQDVALKCSNNQVDASDQCTAWVLHRRGERLTSCDVWSVADDSVGQRQPAKHRRWNISSSWLEQHRLGEHGLMLTEMPKTIALDDSCSEAGWCGYLGTSSGRVVRAQQHGRPGAPLLPTDVLHERLEDADTSAELKAGPVRAFNKRFVGVLQQDRQSVQVLDVARGGLASGRVVLPAEVQASAFCAGGGYGFFLSGGGPNMKLWRMRLPARLNPD